MPKNIYSCSLTSLKGTVLDISSATPCHYRLFHCDEFVNHQHLRIYEFSDISAIKYAAISYVWRGNALNEESRSMDKLGTFGVKGALDADPISLDIMLQVCKAALMEKVEYLWLDRIGIMQTDKEDKQWQIQRMYGIYKGCNICFILPAGVRRLARLEEETSWIQRAWTLQEVLAPKRARMIFIWKHGEVVSTGGTGSLPVISITPFVCGMVDMNHIFESTIGQVSVTTKSGHTFNVDTKIIGHSSHLSSLLGAMNETNRETQAQAIWKCALLRTSSRPVDMVFSIMGIFGVTLDPKSYSATDRAGATIALARKILENGGRASWLGASYYLPAPHKFSALPSFPKTSVSGQAYLRVNGKDKAVVDIVKDSTWWLRGLPKGTMDTAGYFNFRAKAVHLLPEKTENYSAKSTKKAGRGHLPKHIKSKDGRVWQIAVKEDEAFASHRYYAIFLGVLVQYTFGSLASFHDPNSLRALLVSEHTRKDGSRKVHRESYFVLHEELKPMIDACKYRDFSLGGPE